jgi:hypothetical protein
MGDKTVMCRRQQNEKGTFGDNALGVGNGRPSSGNGRGKYKYWDFSATAHRISGASECNSVA